MSAKKVYLVVKSAYRDNKFVFRSVVCVNSSLAQAIRHLTTQLKAYSLDECSVIRILDCKDCILVTRYEDSSLVNAKYENLYEVFEMTLDEWGDTQVHLPRYAYDYLKENINGIK